MADIAPTLQYLTIAMWVQSEEFPGKDGEHIMHAVISAASAIDHICEDRVESEQSLRS